MSKMLERVEKAIGEVAANTHEDVRHVLSPAAIERVARAVLMAVLPTLERYDVIITHDLVVLPEIEKNGEYVRYADLQAILNDGGDQ